MAIQDLIKGEPDWHLKINSNNTEYSNKIGDLSGLTTTDKTSLVNAIKENTTNISNKTNLTTTPQKTTADITYYINASTGADTNNGLTSGTAFKTIQHAIDLLPQIINHTVIINVSSGTYNEGINIQGFMGKGTIAINGGVNNTNAVNYIVNYFYISECSIAVAVTGFTASSISKAGFTVYTCTQTSIISSVVSATSSTFEGIVSGYGGVTYVGSSIISNRKAGLYSLQSTIISENNSGTGNTFGLNATYGGTIAKVNTQPSGTTSEFTSGGGVIR